MKTTRVLLAAAMAFTAVAPVLVLDVVAPAVVRAAAAVPAPTNVCAESGNGTVTLLWDSTADPLVVGHVVEYQVNATGAWQTAPGTPGPTGYTFTGTNGTKYAFRVAATADNGAGGVTLSAWGSTCVQESSTFEASDRLVLVGETVVDVAGIFPMQCFLTASGKVACHTASTFAFVGGLLATEQVVKISASGGYVCAVTATQRLYCWGSSVNGLGDGTDTSVDPVLVSGGALAGKNVVDVAVGWFLACAVTDLGVIACWGQADAASAKNPLPTAVASGPLNGLTIAGIAAGDTSVCAWSTTSVLACWGDNRNHLNDSWAVAWLVVPTAADMFGYGGGPIASVVIGFGHQCILTTEGVVWCWGMNDFGQLGLDSGDLSVNRMSRVEGPLSARTVTRLEAAGDTVCAATSDGGFFCWGDRYPVDGVDEPWFVPTAAQQPSLDGGGLSVFDVGDVVGTWNGIAAPGVRAGAPWLLAPTVNGRAVQANFVPPLAGASPITGYVLQGSTTAGRTWVDVGTAAANATAVSTTLTGDGFWSFRLLAVTALGRGLPSNISDESLVKVGSVGTQRAMRVRVLTESGLPFEGAQIEWSGQAHTLSLGPTSPFTDATGLIASLPMVTGEVDFHVVGGRVSGKGAISEAFITDFVPATATAVTITVPEPTVVTRTITARMPDGKPVPGATLTAGDSGVVGNATFGFQSAARLNVADWFSQIEQPTTTGLTGTATVKGYDVPTRGTDYRVSLEDPGLPNPKFVYVGLTRNVVATLEQYPWLTLAGAPVGAVPVNGSVPLSVHASAVDGSPLAGVAVTLASATGKSVSRTGCTSKLSATTDADGNATFMVCPTASGQWFADGTGVVQSLPVSIALAVAPTQVSAGRLHTCARLGDGTVVCSGNNSFAQLGSGTAGVSPTVPTKVPGLTGVASVSAGGTFTCALSTPGAAGRVRCWGGGASGQIGNGTKPVKQLLPTQVMVSATTALNGVSSVSVGEATACALLNAGANGTVWCWGENGSGQVGDGTTVDKARPVAVRVNATTVLKGVTQVSVGNGSACALLNTGAVRCWGANNAGQLGNGAVAATKFANTVVSGIDGVKAKATAVTVGTLHACARINNGNVRCWGSNATGQLGQGTNLAALSRIPLPVKVTSTGLLAGVTSVDAGGNSTCVTAGTGTAARVRCWGANNAGQLGLGNTTTQRYAVLNPTLALNGVKAVSVGGSSTVALVPSTTRAPSILLGWGGPNARTLLGEPSATTGNAVRPFVMTRW